VEVRHRGLALAARTDGGGSGHSAVRHHTRKEIIMSRKSIIVVAALAAVSISGFAIEAEQFVPPASQLTRAEVRAELRDLRAAGAWDAINEASPTPLQAAAFDAKIAQLQSQTMVALAQPAVTIEVVPLNEVQIEASADMQKMFHHPAIATEADVTVPAEGE
jgi:hypothetical protein